MHIHLHPRSNNCLSNEDILVIPLTLSKKSSKHRHQWGVAYCPSMKYKNKLLRSCLYFVMGMNNNLKEQKTLKTTQSLDATTGVV